MKPDKVNTLDKVSQFSAFYLITDNACYCIKKKYYPVFSQLVVTKFYVIHQFVNF